MSEGQAGVRAAGTATANPCWARGEVTAGHGWVPGLLQTFALGVPWKRGGVTN